MATPLQDLRYGLRMLAKNPGFTAVAVITLALGIGANTAIFSLLDAVMLRLLPVRDPERLVVLHSQDRSPGLSMSDNHQTVFSYPMYKDLRDRSTVFSGVISRASAPVTFFYGGRTERASAEIVSGNFFEVLGVQSAVGRTLTQDDDGVPGAHAVVVLSYGYWTRRFGASPAILNQKVNLNGHPMIVIGVASPSFHGVITGQTPDVLVPIAMKRQITPTWDGLDDRRTRWLNIFARLKPGVSSQQAQGAMQTVYHTSLVDELAQIGHMRNKRAEEEFLAQKLELWSASQGINQLRLQWQTPLVALMAMVGLVLLIACVNVTNLLLARAAGRQREIAIRLAIGASRLTIVRQLLLESLMLALSGGLLGLLVGGWTMETLVRLLPPDSTGGWLSPGVDLRLLGFNLLLSMTTALIFGLVPALRATRPDLAAALRDQAGNAAHGRGQPRFRKALVVAQVSLSLLLLVEAGLFARSLFNLMAVNPGFRAENLMTFSVDPRLNGYMNSQGIAFYRELQERLAALPGVRAVGAANPGPLMHSNRGGNVTVEGYQAKENEYVGAAMNAVSPEYFRTMGIPVLVGREFTDRDGATAPKVVIVNETFVRRFFGAQSPIARHVAFGEGNRIKLDREIVGVVGNSKHSNLREPARPFVYFPYPQDDKLDRMTFYARTDRSENELGSEIRRVVQQMDSSLPIFAMRSMKVQVEEAIYADRLIAILSIAFGLLAALLAAIGLYGVVAYMVARRTAEIGIRMALGAQKGDVLWMVLRETLLLAAVGVAMGIPISLAAARLISSQFFGVNPADPLTFSLTTLLMILVAGLAGYLPARRASQVDPIVALRYE